MPQGIFKNACVAHRSSATKGSSLVLGGDPRFEVREARGLAKVSVIISNTSQ